MISSFVILSHVYGHPSIKMCDLLSQMKYSKCEWHVLDSIFNVFNSFTNPWQWRGLGKIIFIYPIFWKNLRQRLIFFLFVSFENLSTAPPSQLSGRVHSFCRFKNKDCCIVSVSKV